VSSRKLLLVAALSNTLIAALTYTVLGWNAAGAHASARNTARFSALVFIVGFAQPGLARIWQRMPSAATLIQAFVSAHIVHLAAVINTVALDKTHFLRHSGVPGMLTVLVGTSIVLGAGFTARQSGAFGVLHQLLLYANFAIFFTGYFKYPVRQLRVLAVVLAAALLIRVLGQIFRTKAGFEPPISANASRVHSR
jgi:hypothetical protein